MKIIQVTRKEFMKFSKTKRVAYIYIAHLENRDRMYIEE